MSEKSASGRVAILSTPQSSLTMNSLCNESIDNIKSVFNKLGRFMPVKSIRIKQAFDIIRAKDDQKDIYDSAAKLLRVDIYFLFSVSQLGNITYAEAKLVSLNPDYKNLERVIRLKSRIMTNIPLKLGREIAYMHMKLPVKAEIIKSYGDGLFLMNIGQWHGIDKGKYRTIKGDSIDVIQTGRKESIVRIGGKGRDTGGSMLVESYPDTSKMIGEIETRISGSAEYRYGLWNNLHRGEDPGKRLLEGICIVNMFGNILLPGYGAYLSTHYLGFKNPSPSIPGIIISSASAIMHVCLPELMTDFKINILPWKRDSHKSRKMENLQIFLWSTLPLTFTTAYMDQLAFQFAKSEKLPPFFKDHNYTAVFFSTFIPGGGLFYKGHRTSGWSFYFSEMILAGYGVYNKDSGNRGFLAFLSLGAVKLIELISAYYIKPSYAFYNLEMERDMETISWEIKLDKDSAGRNIYYASVDSRF